MQPKSDAQLLREYAESGSESAFTELVNRHTDLVYSAALRQVSSSDLACDVAQNVFSSLARGARALAGKLNPDASPAGWLCRCTRNLALNLRRDDFRRHTRERQAMETLHPSPETAPDWGRLCPLLEEALSGLNETDHDALVLRFFKNHDLRSVGFALGVSDDTAQKRVSRAWKNCANIWDITASPPPEPRWRWPSPPTPSKPRRLDWPPPFPPPPRWPELLLKLQL